MHSSVQSREEADVPRSDGRTDAAAGILNALILCAAFYGLLVGVALVGGRGALLLLVLLVVGLLHAAVTGLAETRAATRSPSVVERPRRHVLSDQRR